MQIFLGDTNDDEPLWIPQNAVDCIPFFHTAQSAFGIQKNSVDLRSVPFITPLRLEIVMWFALSESQSPPQIETKEPVFDDFVSEFPFIVQVTEYLLVNNPTIEKAMYHRLILELNRLTPEQLYDFIQKDADFDTIDSD